VFGEEGVAVGADDGPGSEFEAAQGAFEVEVDAAGGADVVVFVDELAAVGTECCPAFAAEAFFEVHGALTFGANAGGFACLIFVCWVFGRFTGWLFSGNVQIFGNDDWIIVDDDAAMAAENGRWIDLFFAVGAVDFEGCPTFRAVVGVEIDGGETFGAKLLAAIFAACFFRSERILAFGTNYRRFHGDIIANTDKNHFRTL
jgi:hypothetical protein